MLYVSAWYGACFLLSGSHVATMLTNGSLTVGICNATTLWSIPLAGICASRLWSVTYARSALIGSSFHCFSRGLHATHSAVPSNSIDMVGHTALGAWQRATQSLCLPYMAGWVFFSRLCSICPHDHL